MLKLDLHTHSKYSDDSRVEPSEIVRLARERGLDGVAVTDHLSLRGGLEARSANRDPLFLVIPGIEYPTPMGHVVGLFLEEEPAVPVHDGRRPRVYPLEMVIAAIHEKGGIAVLAHPFEARMNLAADLIRSSGLDALEGYNGRASSLRNPEANRMAQDYARAQGLPMVGGSDAHFEWEVARAGCEIPSLDPGVNIEQVRRAVLQGSAIPFGVPSPRTAIPLTGLVKIRKTGRYVKAPKTLMRLALAAMGPTGLWLENLMLGPLDDTGSTH
ncbi:MAG: PHP domain-containing protein [Bacillota bacterium]